MAKLPLQLGIRYLKGPAVFAQLLPGLRPGFVHRAFGVIGSGFRAGKLDGINSAEIARLVALRFQPDIFDAGDSARHVLDAVDGFFPVVVRDVLDRKSTRLNSSHEWI